MLISVAAVVLGGFVIICAAPFTSPRLYKAGGGLFLVSGTAKGALPHVHKYTGCDVGHLGLMVNCIYISLSYNLMSETKPVDTFLHYNAETLDLPNSRKWCISMFCLKVP